MKNITTSPHINNICCVFNLNCNHINSNPLCTIFASSLHRKASKSLNHSNYLWLNIHYACLSVFCFESHFRHFRLNSLDFEFIFTPIYIVKIIQTSRQLPKYNTKPQKWSHWQFFWSLTRIWLPLQQHS